jgi:hypothetical protein
MTRKALVAPSGSKVDKTACYGQSLSPWHSEDKTVTDAPARALTLTACGLGGSGSSAGVGGVGGGGGSKTPAAAAMLDSIDIFTQSCSNPPNRERPPVSWPNPEQRKRKRLYFYLRSGLLWNASGDMRFLTLTSAPGSPPDLGRSFNRLVTVIRRTTPQRLVEDGWLKVTDLGRFYPGKPVDEPLRFEYGGCRTDEGHGVIHLMVSGDYLPVRWLRSWWLKIHAAKQLNIQLIKRRDKVAGYILGQYIGKQTRFIRMYVSRGWLFPGARKSFLELIRRRKAELGDTLGFKTALDDWNAYLLAHRPATSVLAAEDRDASMRAHRKDHHARLSGHFRTPRAAVGVGFDGQTVYSHAKKAPPPAG